MTAPPVSIRPLGWSDWAFARDLASRQDVRARSFDSRPPTLLGHARWMARHILGGDRAYIVRADTGPRIGVSTLHPRAGKVWIGIALRPEWREKGLGTAAVRLTALAGHARFGQPVYAAIKAENRGSLQAFLNAGFVNPAKSAPANEPAWILSCPLGAAA